MILKRKFILNFLMLEILLCMFAGHGAQKNLTDFLSHRKKRGLIFNDGGSVKLVIGPIYPIEFEDLIGWRSLLCLYNIQLGDYKIPTNPLYPWDKWENLYVRSNQGQRSLKPDESREFLYLIFENFMNAKHGNGKECLLRAICENVQIHQYMDLFGEILNVILTPGKGDVDPIYSHAFEIGKSGADCLQYYSKCPQGLSFLDSFLLHNS